MVNDKEEDEEEIGLRTKKNVLLLMMMTRVYKRDPS